MRCPEKQPQRQLSLDKLATPLTGGLIIRSVFAALGQLLRSLRALSRICLHVDPEATPNSEYELANVTECLVKKYIQSYIYIYIYIYIGL